MQIRSSLIRLTAWQLMRRISPRGRAHILPRHASQYFFLPSCPGHVLLAQDQDKPAVAPLPRTINLTEEQRHIIKENGRIGGAEGSCERS